MPLGASRTEVLHCVRGTSVADHLKARIVISFCCALTFSRSRDNVCHPAQEVRGFILRAVNAIGERLA